MNPDPIQPLPATLTTRHARVRCQQRGIPPEMVGLLLEHGRERHVGHGATMLSFSKRRRERLKRVMTREQFAALSSHLDVYAIVGPTGRIMTVGHRYRPMRDKH